MLAVLELYLNGFKIESIEFKWPDMNYVSFEERVLFREELVNHHRIMLTVKHARGLAKCKDNYFFQLIIKH